MDLIEILVLITAVALVALLGAVVLVVLQALFSKSREETSSSKASPVKEEEWDSSDSHMDMHAAPNTGHRTAPKVVVDEDDLFIDEVMDFDPDEEEAMEQALHENEISDEDMDALFNGTNDDMSENIELDTEEFGMDSNTDEPLFEPEPEVSAVPERDSGKERMEPTLNVAQFEEVHDHERMKSYPFMAGRPLLTPIERLFYGDLKATVAEKAEIFPKVRALDVINPKTTLDSNEARLASEQLMNQRFDFVLCDPDDFSVLCIIELEGSDDDSGLKKIQREMLQRSAESAALPVVLVDTRLGYTRKELKERIRYLLPKNAAGYINELLPDIADEPEVAEALATPVSNGYVTGRHAYDTDHENVTEVQLDTYQNAYAQTAAVSGRSHYSPAFSGISLADRGRQQAAQVRSSGGLGQSAFRSGTGHTPAASMNAPTKPSPTNAQHYYSFSPVKETGRRVPWQQQTSDKPSAQFSSTSQFTGASQRHTAMPSAHAAANSEKPNIEKPKLRYTEAEQKTSYKPSGSSQGAQVEGGKPGAKETASDPQQGYYSNSGYSAEKYRHYNQSGTQAGSRFATTNRGSYSSSQARQVNQSGQHPCPRCRSPLTLSMATRGQYQGQYFWVCSNMPSCSYVGPAQQGR